MYFEIPLLPSFGQLIQCLTHSLLKLIADDRPNFSTFFFFYSQILKFSCHIWIHSKFKRNQMSTNKQVYCWFSGFLNVRKIHFQFLCREIVVGMQDVQCIISLQQCLANFILKAYSSGNPEWLCTFRLVECKVRYWIMFMLAWFIEDFV